MTHTASPSLPVPTPATDAELAPLVLEVVKDPAAYRRFLGRLRPSLVGQTPPSPPPAPPAGVGAGS